MTLGYKDKIEQVGTPRMTTGCFQHPCAPDHGNAIGPLCSNSLGLGGGNGWMVHLR